MKSYQPLIISLLAHTVLYLLALLTPEDPLLPPQTQPIEIVYQNETEKSRMVITDPQTELEEALRDLKDKADKLSRLSRRVERETVARKSGPTRNAGDLSPRRRASLLAEDLNEPLLPEEGANETGSQGSSVGGNTQIGVSSLAEYIPEVNEGGFTALNSDQFAHYTFYARINEQVRNRWITNLRRFIETTSPTELNRLAQKTQISQLEIILDADGNFVRSIIHRQSEHIDIDASAVTAFRLASPLNNPPAEMIEEDGYIHLRYGFYVQFRPRYMAGGSK